MGTTKQTNAMCKIFDMRLLMTPIGSTMWTINGIKRRAIYVFGVKVVDWTV